MPKAKPGELTEMQANYVDLYFGEARGVMKDAYKKARNGRAGTASQVYTMHHHPLVQKAIKARQLARKAMSWIQEDDILKGLYNEATNYDDGTPISRISAWVWIGKHLGMWAVKKENEQGDSKLTIEVQNYSGAKVKAEEKKKDVEEKSPLPNNVQVLNYSR